MGDQKELKVVESFCVGKIKTEQYIDVHTSPACNFLSSNSSGARDPVVSLRTVRLFKEMQIVKSEMTCLT